MNNGTKTTTAKLSRKGAKQIEMEGEARNLDAYKSRYDLHISANASELDQFVSRSFQVGSGANAIYGMIYHGSLN